MTMAKLAKLCGVSVSTVSKVFSGSAEISEETRNKVVALAKEAGCFEKYFKPHYPKKQIGVICPEVLGIHYSKLATDIEKNFHKRGATMLLSISNFSAKTQNELIEYYVNYLHIDGIILIDPVGKIKSYNSVPIVAIGMKNEEQVIDYVNIDINHAMDASLEYLQKMGHQKIGFIGETLADNEYHYFLNAMERNALPVNESYIEISDKRFYDAGYYGMEGLLGKTELPTVIYAAYSHIAVGVLQKIHESGYSVPEDFSLICMDDIQSVPYYPIRLASIQMHLDDLAAIAVRILFHHLEENQPSPKQSVLVKREFLVGETIKRIQ